MCTWPSFEKVKERWHLLLEVQNHFLPCQSDFRCATVEMANKIHPIQVIDIEDNVGKEKKGTHPEASLEGKSKQSIDLESDS